MSKVLSVVAVALALGAISTAPAQAADLDVRPIYKAPEMVQPRDYFPGPHIDITFGARKPQCPDWVPLTLYSGGIGAADPISGTPDACLSTGFRGAINGGYDWQLGERWIVGLEGDFGLASDKDTKNGIPGTGFLLGLGGGNGANDSITLNRTWDASIRGKVGIIVMPRLLLFGEGGFAAQHVEASMHCDVAGACAAVGASVDASASTTMTGWTAGGGLEWAATQNLLLRAEYRYADYGSFKPTLGVNAPGSVAVTPDIRLATHTVLLGVGWRFSGM